MWSDVRCVDTFLGTGDNAVMGSQEDRDTVTVDIFTTALIFVLTVAVGAVPMILVHRLLGEGPALDVLGYMVLGCASAASISYLWRHRRP